MPHLIFDWNLSNKTALKCCIIKLRNENTVIPLIINTLCNYFLKSFLKIKNHGRFFEKIYTYTPFVIFAA